MSTFGAFADAIKKPKILVASCVFAILIVCVLFFIAIFIPRTQGTSGTSTSSNVSNGSSVTLFPCLRKSSDSVEKVSGLYTKLAVSSEKSLDWGQTYTDNGIRKFNLVSFKDYTKEQTNQIHFTQKREDGEDFLTYPTSLQICSESNMTVQAGNIPDINVNHWISSGSKNKSFSSTTEAGWTLAPETTGRYRVDAYIYYEGKWRLVDRMNIEFN